MDWTGSERQRKPQGTCLPPSKDPVVVPRFLIKAGTLCGVRPVMANRFRTHVTKKDLSFESFELCQGPCYQFRYEGWIIVVHRDRVVCRNQGD